MWCSERRRILVVDDVADNLFLLQTILELEGYEIETASDGYLALAKLEDSQPDLVLLDVMMPGINGYEVTAQIRQNDKLSKIPILLVTAHEEATVQEKLDTGANGFIRKPINFDNLLERIGQFLS